MALIQCEKCGKEISETMQVCPHCGYERKKEQEKMKTVYNGTIVGEIAKAVIPSIAVIIVAFISEMWNVQTMTSFGQNTTDAYIISQNCLPFVTRSFLLVVIFAICGTVSYLFLKKMGERKSVRAAIAGVGTIIYIIMMIVVTRKHPEALVYGREELVSLVLAITRFMSLFYGVSYGVTTAFCYLSMHGNWKLQFIFPIIEVISFLVIMGMKNYAGLLALGGILSLYNPVFCIFLVVIETLFYIIANLRRN
ncbi:MAG: zinc ribbon domain-containing protein [Acetatifactor sp.]|nr:zinc ribbon domain-containing protein [Acetatifactor sp.]